MLRSWLECFFSMTLLRGNLEKPLIKTYRDLTLRGPGSAEAASLTRQLGH